MSQAQLLSCVFILRNNFKLYINSVLLSDPSTGPVNQLMDIYISHNYRMWQRLDG